MNSLRWLLLLGVLVAVHLPLSTEAALIPERQRLYTAGRYADLEVLMEKEIGNDPNPPSSKLLFQCAAYSRLKRYSKLLPCLDKLDGNIRNGDTAMNDMAEMDRDSPFLTSLARMGAAIAGGSVGGEKLLQGTVEPFVHLMRSEAYNELRDYPRAVAAARAATAAIPVGWSIEPSIRVMALTSQGLAEGFGGNRDEAIRLALELADMSVPTLIVAEKWLGVARIYVSVGEFKQANEALRHDTSSFLGALSIGLADAIAGMDAGDSLFTYVELPKEFLLYKTQFEIGQIAEAKTGFDKLLADKRTASNGEIYWLLLFDRGQIAAREGDLPYAIGLWCKAIEIIEQQRASINTEANKIGFVGDKQAVYRFLIGGLFDTGQFADAFAYIERSKSRALVDMLAAKKDFAVAIGSSAEIGALLAEAERNEIAALGQGVEPKAGTRSLAVAPTEALKTQAPELATLVTVNAIPLTDIQTKLGSDETLVEYYYDQQWIYAFAITRDHLTAVRTESGGLEAEVRAWRAALEDTKGLSQLPLAQGLYQKLVVPVAAHLTRPRLTLVAHGILHYVPLAALHSGTEYLIDKYAIRHLPSASVIQFLKNDERSYPAGALVFGNPDLGDPRLDLAFAQEEAIAVARMVPNSRAFLRKDASESVLRKYAQDFRYLHFATHGEFKADHPLESALILSGDGQDDGLLTVNKLYSMRLDANLVTLSACETGLGKIANGDDVVGLTRGFLYAGAATIVSSLWKVDDKATSELMRAFYAQLSRQGKLDALRSAQLETKRSYPAPYYWAPFQLMGQSAGGQYVAAKVPEVVPAKTPAVTEVKKEVVKSRKRRE